MFTSHRFLFLCLAILSLGIRTVATPISDIVENNFIAQANNGSKYQPWQASFSYNSLGQEVERALPGGLKSRTAYDFAGRPIEHRVSKRHIDVRHRNYQWDANDQLKEIFRSLGSHDPCIFITKHSTYSEYPL